MAKEILGSGWKFPIALEKSSVGDVRNKLAISRYEEKIQQSILIILGTSKGERVMRPDFGCDIHDHVFDIIDNTTLSQLKVHVREALILWEPRIEVLDVATATDTLAEGTIQIDVNYRIRYTNTAHNVVYPFYLDTEGK